MFVFCWYCGGELDILMVRVETSLRFNEFRCFIVGVCSYLIDCLWCFGSLLFGLGVRWFDYWRCFVVVLVSCLCTFVFLFVLIVLLLY